MKKLVLSLALAVLTCSTVLGQPPRTRPGVGGSPQPGASPNATEWPRVRQPGQRRAEGQRTVQEEARATVRVDPNVAPPSRNWYFGVHPERAPRGVRLGR